MTKEQRTEEKPMWASANMCPAQALEPKVGSELRKQETKAS